MTWYEKLPSRLASALNLVDKAPGVVRDFLKGTGLGICVLLPFFVVWLAFSQKEAFSFSYMRELSLLILWLFCLFQIVPLKSVKIGKDAVELSFDTPPMSPADVIESKGEKS